MQFIYNSIHFPDKTSSNVNIVRQVVHSNSLIISGFKTVVFDLFSSYSTACIVHNVTLLPAKYTFTTQYVTVIFLARRAIIMIAFHGVVS